MSFFATYFLPAVLVLITFSIGLTLSVKDFKEIFIRPKAVIIGLLSQMVGLPLLAFLLVYLSGLPPILQVGTMLIAACPGGATSNYVSHLCRGNVALSIALTSINSFLTIVTLPLILYFSLNFFLDTQQQQVINIPFWQTVISIVLLTLLPCVVGMMVRAYWKEKAVWLSQKMEIPMLVLLAAAFAGVMIEKNNAPADITVNNHSFSLGQIFLVALVLNVAGMFIGWGLARATKLSAADQITIGIEVGLQNSMLAITVAGTILHNMEMAQVGVVYGSFTFFTAVIFGLVLSPRVSLIQFFKTRKLYKDE